MHRRLSRRGRVRWRKSDEELEQLGAKSKQTDIEMRVVGNGKWLPACAILGEDTEFVRDVWRKARPPILVEAIPDPL